MKSWKQLCAVALTSAGIVLNGAPVSFAMEGAEIEQKVQQAKTRADHDAIALFYAQEAQTARQQSVTHEKLSNSYIKAGPVRRRTPLAAHCDLLAKKYGEIAKEAEAMAKLHREMAASSQ
jgi:hypothetical protein